MTPSIVIDDTDPAIHYQGGPWLQVFAPNVTNIGSTGSPMFETLHMLPTVNGALTYSFNGTAILAYISYFGLEGLAEYTASCALDEGAPETAETLDNPFDRANNIQMCKYSGLDAHATHMISLNITFRGDQYQNDTGPSGFFFDYFLVTPPPSTSVAKRHLLYTVDDPLVQKSLTASTGGGWTPNGPDTTFGYQAGVSLLIFDFSFTGVSVRWFGVNQNSEAGLVALDTPTYSVDQDTPLHFATAISNKLDGGLFFNQHLFTSAPSSYGNHSLVVFWPGFDEPDINYPLTLQSIVIQGSLLPSSPHSHTTIYPFSTATARSNVIAPTHFHVSAQIGLYVGLGVALIIAIAAAYFMVRRRNKRRQISKPNAVIDYLSPEPFAFIPEQGVHMIGPLKGLRTGGNAVNPFMQDLEPAPPTKWTRRAISSLPDTAHNEEITEDTHQSQPSQENQLSTRPRVDAPADNSVMEGGSNEEGAVRHEEDSGVRLLEARGGNSFVNVLPPIYTAH